MRFFLWRSGLSALACGVVAACASTTDLHVRESSSEDHILYVCDLFHAGISESTHHNWQEYIKDNNMTHILFNEPEFVSTIRNLFDLDPIVSPPLVTLVLGRPDADERVAFITDAPSVPKELVVPGFTGTIILGEDLINRITTLYGRERSAPLVLIYSHEYAHYRNFRYFDRPTFNSFATPHLELMADFLAGWLASHLSGLGVFQQSDLELGTALFYDLGDHFYDSPNHHGTPEQRATAFMSGIEFHRSQADANRDIVPPIPGTNYDIWNASIKFWIAEHFAMSFFLKSYGIDAEKIIEEQVGPNIMSVIRASGALPSETFIDSFLMNFRGVRGLPRKAN